MKFIPWIYNESKNIFDSDKESNIWLQSLGVIWKQTDSDDLPSRDRSPLVPRNIKNTDLNSENCHCVVKWLMTAVYLYKVHFSTNNYSRVYICWLVRSSSLASFWILMRGCGIFLSIKGCKQQIRPHIAGLCQSYAKTPWIPGCQFSVTKFVT